MADAPPPLAAYLARADLPWPPAVVGVLAPTVVLGPVFVATMLGVSAPLLAAALLGPAGVGVAWIHGRVARRPERVVAQLPDALRRVSAGVASGLSLRQALRRAVDHMPEPAGHELRVLSADLDAGARTDDALEALVARVPHHDMDILACVLLVALRAGGDLARLMRELADGIEGRRAAAADLAALSGQARTTAWLVAAMPIGGGAIVELAAPGVLARTVDAPMGRVVMAVAAAMFAVALVAVRRLARTAP